MPFLSQASSLRPASAFMLAMALAAGSAGALASCTVGPTLPAGAAASTSSAPFGGDGPLLTTGDWKKTDTGLQYRDAKVGTGASIAAGQTAVVTYVGWLYTDGKRGAQFDASASHGDGTFSFPLGMGKVIKGWDEGVASMKIGGQRTLLVPAALGYGAAGAGAQIPPNATLVFDVALLKVQ